MNKVEEVAFIEGERPRVQSELAWARSAVEHEQLMRSGHPVPWLAVSPTAEGWAVFQIMAMTESEARQAAANAARAQGCRKKVGKDYAPLSAIDFATAPQRHLRPGVSAVSLYHRQRG